MISPQEAMSGTKVAILGATGFIGSAVAQELQRSGAKLFLLGRNEEKLRQLFPLAEVAYYDGSHHIDLSHRLEGSAIIINLIGESVAQRWNREVKEKIRSSRLNSTVFLANNVKKMHVKPQIVLQASAIGYYGNRGDEILDENSPPGTGFLAELAQDWEKAAQPIAEHCPLAILRFGIVLGKNGGFMTRVAPLFRLFLGGHLGSGKQFLSWIHLKDVLGIVRFLIDKRQGGTYNVTSPQPLAAKEFFRELGKAIHRPSWLHAPEFVLHLLYGEMAKEVLLSGQRVLPLALQQKGYSFRFPILPLAIHSLLHE
ncbi:MAG: TIGR01777 family oxidoreductase [Leptospiraceae bacterium]|nr:TIGR01777 family oxidoreductase [Leptospiraceae bacterium]MDW8306815.1 TIGR01777 family oxidoreductase [Leptospiraceae bacterium]